MTKAVISERAKRLREEWAAEVLSVDEVAFILSMDRSTVIRYINEHRIFAYQLGRSWQIPVKDFREYVAQLKAKPAQQEAEG